MPEAPTPEYPWQGRQFYIEAVATTAGKMAKEATFTEPEYMQGFTVRCDEGPPVGGDNTAPSPLAYFLAAVGF